MIAFFSQLDNHGNHMLLTDESPINVPGIAAAHVIKRYTAQAADEISLEVRLYYNGVERSLFQSRSGFVAVTRSYWFCEPFVSNFILRI